MYRAADEVTNRVVRLTVVSSDRALIGEAGERCGEVVRAEAAAVGALRHGGVVAVRSAGPYGTGFLWAEDLVGGPSLNDVLALEGPQPPARVLTIAADLVDALDAAHCRGVVHGGLSPAEVHLPAGVDGSARLGGFGLAGALARTFGPNALDARYLAPEQRAGEAAGTAADWWALGAVLHEALIGGPWVTAAEPASEVAVRTPAPDASPAIRALLAPDPADRPQTAAEVRALLAIGRAGGAGLDQRPSEGERPRRSPRLTWALVACAAVALIGLGLIGAVRAGLVASGADGAPVAMPHVVGAPQEAAATRLEALGLDTRVEVQPSTTVDAGAVISQQPAAGVRALEGDLVTVVVSTGAGTVLIPDVLGLTEAEAARELVAAGLVPRVETRVSGTDPPGTITHQAGNGGDQAERGSEIRLTVAVPA